MFVKIKLDRNPIEKDAQFFELRDDASVSDLKKKIEEFLGTAAESLEIKSITKTFTDDSKMDECWSLAKEEGVTLLLYNKRNGSEESQFVCCLQLYSNDGAEKQQALGRELKASATVISCSPLSTCTLVGNSDDSLSTSSSSSGSSESESSSSESNDVPEHMRKRKHSPLKAKETKKQKGLLPLLRQFDPSLREYLNELPEENNFYFDKIGSTTGDIAGTDGFLNKPSGNLLPNSQEKRYEDTPKSQEPHTQAVQITSSDLPANERLPSGHIAPEKREYIVVISCIGPEQLTAENCDILLNSLFDKFHQSNNLAKLEFDENSGVKLFDGKLWIACDNQETFDWISTHVQQLAQQFKLLPYPKLFNLKQCSVVLPVPGRTRSLKDVFELMEKQNPSICTAAWIVQRRTALSEKDGGDYKRCVSCLSPNEILFLSIDADSEKELQQLNFKLKYCFWKIVFEMAGK